MSQLSESQMLLNIAEESALKAAAHVVLAGDSGRTIVEQRKEDGSWVLDLDVECQALILEVLKADLPIAAEEDPATHHHIGSRTRYFVVDPIDGTSACKRFLRARGGQVGFGPIVGLIENGQVMAATFYNVPDRTLYSALRGAGCFRLRCEPIIQKGLPELDQRERLNPKLDLPLRDCAMLFYTGEDKEAETMRDLRKRKIIDVGFRFGGFANDASRIAQGLEQIQLQYKVKAWDVPATLFAEETGYAVIFDPIDTALNTQQWCIQQENPVLIAPPQYVDSLMPTIKRIGSASATKK
jgi:fructose-1,6-bisphosphatase/inositol monophosphatase family enzyme